jgi:hypothetical protein
MQYKQTGQNVTRPKLVPGQGHRKWLEEMDNTQGKPEFSCTKSSNK